MGGRRVSVPGSLNHRFMLPLTTPSAPEFDGLLGELPGAMEILAGRSLSLDFVEKIPYLGFEGGDILRPGAFLSIPPWRGGAGGRRTFCQAGFWRRLTGWAMANL